MALDKEAAKAAGYTDDEIAAYEAQQPSAPAPAPSFDVDGARAAGYSDDEIADHLKKRGIPNPNRPDGSHQPTNDDLYGAVKDAVTGLPQKFARIGSDAAFALPNMAGDFGVGVRNLYGKLTGGQSDYEYPSDSYRRGMDALLPGSVPKGKAEALEMALGPMVVGSGSARAPALVRALRTPAIATEASEIPTTAPSTLPEAASTVLGGATPTTKAANAPMFDEGGNPLYVSPETLTSPEQKRQRLVDVLAGAHDLGMAVPRVTSNPTGWNRAVETWGGKIATHQEFSNHNQEQAQRVMAGYVGLNPDSEITPKALEAIRKDEGKHYQAFAHIGPVRPDNQLRADLGQVSDRIGGVERDFPGSPVSPVRGEIDSILGTSPATRERQQRLVQALTADAPSARAPFSPVVPRGSGPGVDPLTLNPRSADGIGPLGNPPPPPDGAMPAATAGPRSTVQNSPLMTPERDYHFDPLAVGTGKASPGGGGAAGPKPPTDPLTLNPQTKTFDARNIISKVSQLRDEADVAGRAGNKNVAAQYKATADALEAQVQREVEKRIAAGDTSISPDAVQKLKDARVRIAKTYTTQDVLKSGGRIDLHALGNMVDNGEPITGDARTLGQFASQFRKATMDPAKLGSRGVSHLEGSMGTMLTAGGALLGEHGEHGIAGTLAGLGAGIALPITRRMAVNANLKNTAAQVPEVIKGIPRPGSPAAYAQALMAMRENQQ